ncbi:hypothetical protein BABINDRAFT_42567 [Babjeviella inositovora NRRL Y-12698]|uniref:Heat shock protein 9/12 n=1 Tax=Babjeviella inositovora NRRL Y-12698 TaxID=984486 RepID=A0A1E3QGV1_9ASCO|nr:uncharacterized protein BABINDRAFT_42567 [Babjeviella inositovora NRRL Y-12698]ODQ76933.1 hypothetical protein BABINDRAFT_42567 [Babjeviella inositovora NRRL Y-12698]
MSQAGRQDFTDKVSAAVKPDSQKGIFEKAKDTIVGTADNAAGKAQPEEDKTAAQKVGDTVFGK